MKIQADHVNSFSRSSDKFDFMKLRMKFSLGYSPLLIGWDLKKKSNPCFSTLIYLSLFTDYFDSQTTADLWRYKEYKVALPLSKHAPV